MTDELTTDGGADEQDFDIEVAADANILTDEGSGEESGGEVVETAGESAAADVPITPEQQRAKFEQTRDIDDLPEADRPFFRRYKSAFNKEMQKARSMVKEAAERAERYEALLARGQTPEKQADGPPDLGDDIDPTFKTALDARVQYEVQKALEASGLTKRLESAEERAFRVEGESRARDIMSELTTKHGMTVQEQQMIEGWIGEDPNTLVNFQTPTGRARMVKMARVELQEAQARVTTVQRQANAAGAAISRPGGGAATHTPTDYRKVRDEKGMDGARDLIVEETLREMGGTVPNWP
jgi:hypothetical protein